MEQTCFAVVYYGISEITAGLKKRIRLLRLSKSYLYKYKVSFYSIEHLSFISVFTFELKIKPPKLFSSTMFDVRKEHIALHITKFVQQYLYNK